MGLTQQHALARLLKFFHGYEATAGTFEKAVATDAAKVLKVDFALEQERAPREDSRQTRSLLERITQRANVTWAVEAEVIPSGTAGTPPDLHDMLYAAFGGYTNTPATSDAYTLANTQTLRTLSMTRHVPDVIQESVWGAWVDKLTMSISGTERPKLKFEGGAMGYALTGTSTLNGAMSGSTTMVVQTADGNNFATNSVVQVGSDDNSSAGYKVTVDSSRPSFTIESSATASNSDDVLPFAPSETTAGSPIASIVGSLTYDSASVPITAAEVTLTNNIRPIDDEAFAQYVSDVVPGYRDVNGSLTLRCRKDLLIHFANRRAFSTRAATIALGTTAGAIATISIPYLEVDFAAVDIPAGDGDVICNVPFTALGSSGEDELSLTFT
jgi:hypothetical protein